MIEINEIVKKLGEYIKKHKHQNQEFKNKLLEIRTNPSMIEQLDMNLFRRAFGEDAVNSLNVYNMIFNNGYFPATEEQKRSFVDFVLGLEQTLNSVSNLDDIKKLKYKLENIEIDEFLDFDSVKLLCKFMKEMGIDSEKIARTIQELVFKSLKYLESTNHEIDDDYEEETEEEIITLEQALELFQEYGYDGFSQLDDKHKNKILENGRYANMKEILEVFEKLKERGVFISFKERGEQFCTILAYSKASIIESVIQEIDRTNNAEDKKLQFKETFEVYLENCDYLIFGKERKGDNHGGGTSGKSSEIIGHFQTVQKNREFIATLPGVEDINKLFNRCSNVFAISNEKIRKVYGCLKFYGINMVEHLDECLSFFHSSDILSTIDQFIELNLYEYCLQKFSYTLRACNDEMFYRIIKHYQLDENIWSLRSKDSNLQLLSKIGLGKNDPYGIKNKLGNGPEIVGQYTIEPELFEEYDKATDKIIAMGPIRLAYESEFIRKLDSSVYKNSEFEYIFNGVRISRKKVLRYYELLKKLNFPEDMTTIRYVIYKNSILTEQQYLKVEECLDRLFGLIPRRGGI